MCRSRSRRGFTLVEVAVVVAIVAAITSAVAISVRLNSTPAVEALDRTVG